MANALHFSTESTPESDDNRSSSLSDLDEGPEPEIISGTAKRKMAVVDGDSEAETERLEISPNKTAKDDQVVVDFASLDQNVPESSDMISAIHKLESGRFSESEISSPVSTDEDLLSNGVSERIPGVHTRVFDASGTLQVPAGQKRKRARQENGSDLDAEQEDRARRKRTGSIGLEAEHDPSTSDDDVSLNTGLSRAVSQDQLDVNEEVDEDAMVDVNDDDLLPRTDQASNVMSSSNIAKSAAPKARKSLHEDLDRGIAGPEEEDQVEEAEESDEEDLVEADEAEDAEAVARSEEERKKAYILVKSVN